MRLFSRIALLVSMGAGLSYGIPVTFVYNGVVTAVGVDDIYGDIAAGDVFQVSFTFDSNSGDLIPGDSNSASYLSAGGPYSVTLTLPTHVFVAADSVSIGILNSFIDQYTVFAQGSGGALTLELLLQDNSGTAWATDGLPLVAPPLSAFPFNEFHFREVQGSLEVQVDGQLTGLAEVPEPSTVFHLCIGAAFFSAVLPVFRNFKLQGDKRL
jgi:hypothetical protein